MGYIYLITNLITKKQYVGQSLCKDIEHRWNQHRKLMANCLGRYLLSAYKKYGINNFKFQIICICFDIDTNKYESDYIKKYNTLVPNGYNLQEGGKNSKQHPETIALRVQKLKGRKYGPPSDEIRAKISEALKGSRNGNFGKKMSNEQKNKLSELHKQMWQENKCKDIIPKSIENQLIALKSGSALNKKRLGQFDTSGNLLEEFTCITDASKLYNISHSTISRVCNNKSHCKTAAGFIWKFL